MDFIKELGVLALGSRLKRLLERMNGDISRFYRTLGVGFEARWFPIIRLLGERSPLPITGIADALGLTHPAVNKLVALLARAGLVASATDERDRRRRLVELTKKGRVTHEMLQPVWEDMRGTLSALHEEPGCSFLASLEHLEDELAGRSLFRRLTANSRERLMAGVEIVDFRPELKKHFERLNKAWLKKQFGVERHDKRVLSDPEATIIAGGGKVFFARVGDSVAGTCALIRHEGGIWELAKLAVDEGARGRFVGTRLALSAIEGARMAGAESVLIETSPTDERALAFFESMGFARIGSNPLPARYTRERVTMELKL